MLDCTQDSLLAPWILESTPLLSCAVGDKRSTTSIQSHSKWKPAVNSGMKSLGNTVVNGTCTAGGKLGVDEDDDDLFSTNRSSYSSTFCRVGGARPTMISAKYRQKEERRKVLKISISKLKKIEDPESSLRRSVLINNTMKRLQREAREEKLHKQQAINSGFNRCFAADFFKDDENTIDQVTSVQSSRSTEQLVDITNLPEITNSTKTSPMTSALMSKPTSMTTTSTTTVVTSICLEDCLGCDETMPDVVDSSSMLCSSVTSNEDSPANRGAGGRKRSFDDVDDSDVQDVLSQFYMPPTPRMLTSIDDDEDEDVNVVDLDTPCEKRPRLECEHEQSAADRLKNMTRQQTSLTCVESIEQRLTMSDNIEQRLTMSDNIEQRLTMSNNIEQRLTMSASDVSERCSSSSGGGASTSSSSSSSSFSCGHSSMFNELQSVVYHSLIASLET